MLSLYLTVALAVVPPTPEAKPETVWPSATLTKPLPVDQASPANAPLGGDVSAEKKAQAKEAMERLEEQERSFSGQIIRTLLSLLVVVGLIYLVFRVIVPRFFGVALPTRNGKSLRVLERVQLDGRHSVVVIELDGQRRLLLGTSERGVELLMELGGASAPLGAQASGSFSKVLNKTQSAEPTPQTCGPEDAHHG